MNAQLPVRSKHTSLTLDVLAHSEKMASLSLNTIKHIMRAMVDSPGFDRVLSKVNTSMVQYFVMGRGSSNMVGTSAALTGKKQEEPVRHDSKTLIFLSFTQVDILSASPGKVVCEMRVEEEHTNRGGTLHGGLTATLVDVISTMAIMYSERAAPGVSVDMNIT